MNALQRLFIGVLFCLGLAGALWSAYQRVHVEHANRTVALCVDDLEVRQLALITGQTPLQLLSPLKHAGITHIALSERTLGELLQNGEIRLIRQGASCRLEGLPDILMPIWRRLRAAGFLSPALPFPYVAPIIGTMSKLGITYDEEACTAAQQAGLHIVARPLPDYLLTPKALEAALQNAKSIGAQIVLFNGISVGGGVQMAPHTADILKRLGLQFSFVELIPQEGAAQLASALGYQIIRTHSISQEEMFKTTAWRGLERFTLAVTERNIRLCYIRLLLNPQPDIVQANVAYIRGIHDALYKAGFAFGAPQPFEPLQVPKLALLLLACGVVGGGIWLVYEIFRPHTFWIWLLGFLGLLVALGGSLIGAGLIPTLFSFLAAVIFPSLAILFTASRATLLSPICCAKDNVSPLSPASCCPLRGPGGTALLFVLLAALLTAYGGFLIAGMLSSSAYMMQIAQFRGVKLAQLLPLLLVLFVMIARTYAPRPAQERAEWLRLRQGLIFAAEAFVKYWHAGLVFLVLGLVAFMIMRSGNESAVQVPIWELKLRAFLDQLLLVRPRTKEIFVGFPALLLGLTLLLAGRPRMAWAWLSAGVIALISLTNTFCHIHTPLMISLLRIFNGIWLGLFIGIIVLFAKFIIEQILLLFWQAERI